MNNNLSLARGIYLFLAFGCITATLVAAFGNDSTTMYYYAAAAALCFVSTIFVVEYLIKNQNLKNLTTVMVGLMVGYLLGQSLIAISSPLMLMLNIPTQTVQLSYLALFIFGTYFGLVLTMKASGEFTASIPFLNLTNTVQQNGKIILDRSSLADPRIIDIASSGLIDGRVAVPYFIIKSLHAEKESSNEEHSRLAKSSLETLKKLEALPNLKLERLNSNHSTNNTDLENIKEIALASGAYIFTSKNSKLQQSSLKDVRVINMNTIANAIKPLSNEGEYLNIKIQRYGKEARQGVGYLDDGTMVVINGGAEHIGETIKGKVLSLKHTSSGRMIFCNATDEDLISDEENSEALASLSQNNNNYFSL